MPNFFILAMDIANPANDIDGVDYGVDLMHDTFVSTLLPAD